MIRVAAGSIALWLAWALVAPATLRAQVQEGACGPVLQTTDSPEAVRSRWAAVIDARRRFGFRTPRMVEESCLESAHAEAIRLGARVRHGQLLYAADSLVPFSARRVENRVAAAAAFRGWLRVSPAVEMEGELAAFGTEAELRRAYLALQGAGLYGWIGRREVGYGLGLNGAIVLAGDVPLDGIGIGLKRPVRLPFVLAYLGEFDLEGVVAIGGDNGDIGHPWLGAARGTWTPLRGITFGATRAAMASGDGAPGLTGRRLWSTIIGSHLREDGERLQFNNQIMTLDAVVRAPIAGMGVALYAELGAEDAAGAWVDSPSVVAGLEIAHPKAGWVVGLVQSYIHPENGHGYFYRHSLYEAGWSDRGRGLGHPLAGPGREWQLGMSSFDVVEDRWVVDAGIFVRDRYRGNSMGPGWIGRAVGGRLEGRVGTGDLDFSVDIDLERHDDGADRVLASLGLRWTRGPLR